MVEEHRAEPADRHVEALARQRMPLDIRALVNDVAEPRRSRERPGALDHRIRSIDPEHHSRGRELRRLAGGLPGPAPDVEHAVRGADSVRASQHVVVVPQFEVVVDHALALPVGRGAGCSVGGVVEALQYERGRDLEFP
jgi:hypothetical protein